VCPLAPTHHEFLYTLGTLCPLCIFFVSTPSPGSNGEGIPQFVWLGVEGVE
jgi:hypothetical protein